MTDQLDIEQETMVKGCGSAAYAISAEEIIERLLTAREAVASFQNAAIEVAMVTGGHPMTALAIARVLVVMELHKQWLRWCGRMNHPRVRYR